MTSIQDDNLDTAKTKSATATYMTTIPVGYTAETKLVKQNHKPSFIMCGSGNGIENKGTYSMDYTEMLLGLSKPAGFMFGLLMKNRLAEEDNYGVQSKYKKRNLTFIVSKHMTSPEKKSLTKGYKELLAKDMVVRVKRGWYIINPRLVISGDNWTNEEREYTDAVELLQDNIEGEII